MSDELYENEIYILKLATNPKTYETLTTFMKSQPRHPISQSKMKEWINKQPYTLFTDVAQYICNNITYIPVEKVIEKIENVGTYIYERHYNQGHNFVFHVTNYIGLEQKSNSFFTVLVMSYIYTKYKFRAENGVLVFGEKNYKKLITNHPIFTTILKFSINCLAK